MHAAVWTRNVMKVKHTPRPWVPQATKSTRQGSCSQEAESGHNEEIVPAHQVAGLQNVYPARFQNHYESGTAVFL